MKKIIKQKNVFVGKNVTVEPNVFFDTSNGKIEIGDGTKIKANVALRGPLSIGKNCVINTFSEISDSIIGDVCKIGGEVVSSTIGSYTNKAHHGFLGHSQVGSWVNIGGGTSVSNMKNTYGNIKVLGVDTGKTFVGCVIGDYVKTAVNTSIFCGKVIGTASHIYGTVTEDVPPFVNHVATGKLFELPLEVAIKVQKAMSARRNVPFTEDDKKNFEKMFKETALDRKKSKVKKGKLSFK